MTTRNPMRWHDPPAPSSNLERLHQSISGHPLVAQILAQRGCNTLDAASAFLHPEYYSPTPPDALPDLAVAAQALERAIQAEETILVWGDFDVDGQTASALLVDGLKRLGAHVALYIPNRLRESHGVRLESLREQVAQLRPRVLLTCDTGVSAHPAIDYAKAQGIVTLITDHHDLPPTLPDADAVVNPKRLPADHPLATLPGVGVAYKLVEQLYTRQGHAADLPDFLDLAALGIVADVADQRRDTRYLLQIGLDCLRHTLRVGLQALMEVAQLSPERLTASDIAFQLGPRLNAAGRLDDARLAVDLLTTPDMTRARLLALQLEGLNNQRRLLNGQIYAAAQEQIARDPGLLDWEALVLAHEAWHAGIIGIVASRLAEIYGRPVVLLSVSDDGLARGSARSVPGYDIGAAVAAQAELLIEYGGHPGAAGMSLHADHIPAFRRRLSDTLRETHDPDARPGLQLDAYIPFGAATLDLVQELNRLAPFGEGNPPVTLASSDLTLKSAAHIGRTREHRRLIVEDISGYRQNVLWWNGAEQPLPDGLFDLAYHLETNTFQGSTELQLVLVDYRRSASAPVVVERPRRQVTDLRRDPHPEEALNRILKQFPGALVWAEGFRRAESPGLPLSELTASDALVVYTAPTGPYALQEALERVQPVQVVLIAVDPPIQGVLGVQRRLLELVKHVLNQQKGQTTLQALAEAVGQAPATVRLALDHTAAQGEISVNYGRGDRIQIAQVHGTPATDEPMKRAAFNASVAETEAYRAFFRRAAPPQLLGDEP
jgi:single-stranded-DNA-specific exonuclease